MDQMMTAGEPAEPGITPIPVPPGFPVKWDTEEEANLLWSWDEFHAPLPRSPMSQSLAEITRVGMNRATRETGRYTSSLRKTFNGYPYSAALPKDETAEDKQLKQALIDKAIESAWDRWQHEWEPKLVADLEQMKSVDLSKGSDIAFLATLDRFLALHGEHWYLHHLIVMPTIEAASRLEQAYVEAVGEKGKADAHKLLHGTETKTARSIRALDALATASRKARGVAEAVDDARDVDDLRRRLATTPAGRAWRRRFEGYLSEFGYRTTGFDFIYPTWIEDPSFVLMNIRARVASGAAVDLWAKGHRELGAERARLLAAVEERLAAEPERLARFRRIYETAQRLWPLKEDHSFYIDQASTALVRHGIAELGRRLAGHGLIARPEDVYFLVFAEASGALRNSATPGTKADGLDRLARTRRAEREAWSRLRPPKYLGAYPADYKGERESSPAITEAFRELRGTAASAGSGTGRAVVVMSPDDFDKVRKGDVLVCRSTAPMWTPLFEIVAGLVSEAGGMLSHPAVVAREFGLPAAVGVRGATALIRDGQVINVSGTEGIVRLVE